MFPHPLSSSLVRLSASLPLAAMLSGCTGVAPTGPGGAPALAAKAPWNAATIVLTNDALRAEIVPAWAGRLMFFGRPGGPNVLWTWPEAARFTVDAGEKPVWRNVGGEKTWVGSQGRGWCDFAGKESGRVWPPPAWFDSEPMRVVRADTRSALLRTGVHRGGDWEGAMEREFVLEGERLVVHERLLPTKAAVAGDRARTRPDDDRRLWSVAQVPQPDRVAVRLVGEGRHANAVNMPDPVSAEAPGWVWLELADPPAWGKTDADGDALAMPLPDGSSWLVVEQTAPERHLAGFAAPGRAMVYASKPDFKPSPYAELEFAAYGPDAEQTVEFRLADDPFAPDAPECASCL